MKVCEFVNAINEVPFRRSLARHVFLEHTSEFYRHRQIYLLTAIGLTPGGSSTVHIYTQTVHRTTQLILEECRLCPVYASYTLEFALQLRKKQGKTSVRVAAPKNTFKEVSIP